MCVQALHATSQQLVSLEPPSPTLNPSHVVTRDGGSYYTLPYRVLLVFILIL